MTEQAARTEAHRGQLHFDYRPAAPPWDSDAVVVTSDGRPARSDDVVVDLPPLVPLDPPVEIEVLADGEWWPGRAAAHRGRRVSVTYTRGPGLNHVTWVPAEQVRRV